MKSKARKSSRKIRIINPYSGKVVGEVKRSSKTDVSDSIKRARNAFENADLNAHERYKILRNAAERIKKERTKLASLITNEIAKPIRESLGEVDRAYETMLFCAEETKRISGQTFNCDAVSTSPRRLAISIPQPLGVVAAICPFNFPLNIAVHKVGPALAAGNTVVLKPSEKSPLTPMRLRKILIAAGLNEDAFQILIGGSDIGQYLVKSEVDMINFTGSSRAGNQIAKAAEKKRLLLELGGNDPLVVMADADVEKCVDVIMVHKFAFAGQRCTALKRLYVHNDIFDLLTKKIVERVKRLTSGDPNSKKTDISVLVDSRSAKVIEKRIQQALKKNAVLLAGGKRKRNFIEPTVICDIDPSCELIKEETFGPVLPIMRFDSLNRVIEQINSTKYGLQAGIITKDISCAMEFANRVKAGTVAINNGPSFRAEHIPFGGVKESGLGREGAIFAVKANMETKTVII